MDFDRIRIRRNTTESWKNDNPKLKLGEIAVDTTLWRLKVGNGSDFWNDLPYIDNELYIYIEILIKSLFNIIGTNGTMLLSINNDQYDLEHIENPQEGDIVLCLEKKIIYIYKNSNWEVFSIDYLRQINKVNTVEDLDNVEGLVPGLRVYVEEDKHEYQYNGEEWNRILTSGDSIYAADMGNWQNYINYYDENGKLNSVLTYTELTELVNPVEGQIMWVSGEKRHYYFDGHSWIKSNIQA